MTRTQYSRYERPYPVQTFKEIDPRGRRSNVKVTLSTEERHRIYERLNDLEKKQDSLYRVVAFSTFAVLAVGVGLAAYQHSDAIETGATWAWESMPKMDRLKNEITKAWESFVSFFSNPPTYGY